MWVGPDRFERSGTVIHVTNTQTTILSDGLLFGRPTSEVELIDGPSQT